MPGRWAEVGFNELLAGVRERPGKVHNLRILEYFRATNLTPTDDETPWCAAFVGWCLQQDFVHGTGKAAARSYMGWGRMMGVPKPGAITVFWRGDPNGWQGHVAFYVGEEAGKILVLGGNQGNAVSIRGYRRNRLLGYRWPTAPDRLV